MIISTDHVLCYTVAHPLCFYQIEIEPPVFVSRYYERDELISAIENLPYAPFGRTYTADALDLARTGVNMSITFTSYCFCRL